MWQEYQQDTALLLQSMGFNVTVDAEIEGAQGIHKIDVWVVGRVQGVELNWVIDCKDWKTNVPREKVLALAAVVRDVGADRGFLLSEIGFQSGALRVAHNANITLTNVADLREAAHESLIQSTGAHIHWRMTRVKRELLRLHRQADDDFSEYMRPITEIAFLDLALEDALHGKFPAVYAVPKENERLTAASWDEFVEKATELIDRVENLADEAKFKNADRA